VSGLPGLNFNAFTEALTRVGIEPAEVSRAYADLAVNDAATVVSTVGGVITVVRTGTAAHRLAKADSLLTLMHEDGALAAFRRDDPFQAEVDKATRVQRRRKLDPKATLADDVLDARLLPKAVSFDVRRDRELVRQAKRYVFDEAACRLATRILARPDPPPYLRFLENAEPPSDVTWIETSAWTEQDEIRRLAREHPEWGMASLGDAHPSDRTGWLFSREPGSPILQVFTWMHSMEGAVVTFPLYHLVALEGAPFRQLKEGEFTPDPSGQGVLVGARQGRLSELDQAAVTWNCELRPDFAKPMVGRGRIVSRLDMIGNVPADRFNWFARNASRGLPFAILYLSMLNSVAIVDEAATRPAGSRLVGGSSRPYLTRQVATVVIPKRIRRPVDWALREMREAVSRKRLHEVSPHYRHLTHAPKAPGWVEVEIEGVTYWRKRIAAHLRGNPDLGVVEHDHTVVRGPAPP
jgi:hypothetical protein